MVIVKTAKTKRQDQASGIVYACHVEEEIVSHCVLDYGDKLGCRYAIRRRVRETCQYWQPAPPIPRPLEKS